jgi:hypothetical protein
MPFVAGAVAEQRILVALDRADHDVDRVGLHSIQAMSLARKSSLEQRVGAHLQVLAEGLVLRQRRGLAQQRGDLLQFRLVGLVEGHELQLAVVAAAHQRVPAVLARAGCACSNSFLRHVARIEVDARRARAEALDERLVAVEPVPGAEIDLGELARGRIGDAGKEAVAIDAFLLPEQQVHRLRGLHQQREQLAVLRVERRTGRPSAAR